MKIYVVMTTWKERYYCEDTCPDKAFVSKEKAQKYCDEENKRIKEDVLEELGEIPYSDEELKEIMEENGYYKNYIEEIELEDAGASLHAE